jgi:hypothetical protein
VLLSWVPSCCLKLPFGASARLLLVALAGPAPGFEFDVYELVHIQLYMCTLEYTRVLI